MLASDSSREAFGILPGWPAPAGFARGRTVVECARTCSLQCSSQGQECAYAGGWSLVATELEDEIDFSIWEQLSDHPQVPARALRPDKWKTVFVHVLEARGIVEVLRRTAFCQPTADHGLLALNKNLAVARQGLCAELVISRCLSRYYKNRAYCLARNLYVAMRWIVSETSLADRGWRSFFSHWWNLSTKRKFFFFKNMRPHHEPRPSVYCHHQVPIISHSHLLLWHK